MCKSHPIVLDLELPATSHLPRDGRSEYREVASVALQA